MDVIIREHDISHAGKAEVVLLNSASVENGLDKYVTDVVSTVYGERLLAQIFRLVDARVERVMRRQLVSYAESVVEEPEFVLEAPEESL
jgi:hypothetical protein